MRLVLDDAAVLARTTTTTTTTTTAIDSTTNDVKKKCNTAAVLKQHDPDICALMDTKFGRRSAVRRRIGILYHGLAHVQQEEERLQCLRCLIPSTCSGLARRITDYEESLLRLDQKHDEQYDRCRRQQQQQQQSGGCCYPQEDSVYEARQEVLSRIVSRELAADVAGIVLEMQSSIALYSAAVHAEAMAALKRLCLSNDEHKLRLVNCNGVAVILNSMNLHPTVARLQQDASSLLVTLPFCSADQYYCQQQHERDGSSFSSDPADQSQTTTTTTTDTLKEHHSNSNSNNKSNGNANNDKNKNSSNNKNNMIIRSPKFAGRHRYLDIGIANMLLEAGAHESIRAAVEEECLNVNYYVSGDMIGNYERRLASQQSARTCAALSAAAAEAAAAATSTGTTTTRGGGGGGIARNETNRNNNKTAAAATASLCRQLCFLRQCMASLLDDTSITPDTLSSFLMRSSHKRG